MKPPCVWIVRIGCALSLWFLHACAPTTPIMGGGRTVPGGRSDIAIGAAARVALDRPETADTERPPLRTGATPVALYRYGINSEWDMGMRYAGLQGGLDIRFGKRFGERSLGRILAAFQVNGGALLDPYASTHTLSGYELSGHLPVSLNVDLFSIMQLWLGPRIGVHYAREWSEMSPPGGVTTWDFDAGGFLGLGFGFRHLHILMEVAIDHRWRSTENEFANGTNTFWHATPAVALRLRL